MNKTIQMGHLVRDPEFKTTTNGNNICTFTLANNYEYKDYKETLFLNCTAFGKTGETIAKFFNKGSKIIVEGRLKTESWEKEGQKRSQITMTVERFYFPESKKAEKPNENQPNFEDIGNPFDDNETPF